MELRGEDTAAEQAYTFYDAECMRGERMGPLARSAGIFCVTVVDQSQC